MLLLMIGSASLVQASHALLNNFASIEWMRQGMSETVVGELWATGIVSEALLLWFGRRLLGGRSPALLLVLGAVGAVVRWVLMARLPTGVSLFAVQLLNGPSIMAPILAIMLYIERRVAPHLIASAQGMYVPAWSACMAIAMLACGPLWHTLQAGAYFVMALTAAAGGVIALCAWQASAGGVRTALRFVQ
jgi:PPP family 3-phenylpropionic acid transporter